MPIHFEELDAHVALITIDRPERRNSLDVAHFGELAAAWRRFEADDSCWIAVITGTAGCFCAGADLRDFIPKTRAMAEASARGETEFEGYPISAGTDAVLRSLEITKPIVAAIGGPCVAGGMEMLGGVDIRVASPSATFGVMEPKRGLFAGGGTTARLPRQLNWPAAMEFLLTAEALPAERALRLGLLNEVVEDEESLLPRALEWAARITANAPLAVRATKESALRCLAASTMEEAYRIEQQISLRVFATEDAREGPRAFVEKRPPVWRGA